MPKDIRDYFKRAVPKKKPRVLSDDNDIIEESPIANNSKKSLTSSTTQKTIGKEALKPIEASNLFSSTPVKQSKTQNKPKNRESEQKRESNFNKTIQELDDDLDVDFIDLDRTIDETLREDPTATSTKTVVTPKGRKRKGEDLDESGIDPDQQRYERKRMNYDNYQKYLNRSAPTHKGVKEMPEGTRTCLTGLCILKTGVLDSLDSTDLNDLVAKHGGRTVKSVSRKVNYIIVGEDPGPSKIEKAESYGIKQITEDEFLDMILIRSGKPAKYCKSDNEDASVETANKKRKISESSTFSNISLSKTSPKKTEESKIRTSPRKSAISDSKISPKKVEKVNLKALSQGSEKFISKTSPIKTALQKSPLCVRSSPRKTKILEEPKNDVQVAGPSKAKRSLSATISVIKPQSTKNEISDDNKSWTEKYKPDNIKSVIGQQDSNSNMKKLLNWLLKWNQFHGAGNKKVALMKPSPWAKNDDGSYFKAALLSGPPGVGKTTTAMLVAKELGFDVVEFNASDTRNKKLLHEEISTLLSSKSLVSFFKDGTAPTCKHVLLMDEVDGMSGNEDRGGVQELISLIKNSSVPIICMCNDRQHPKIRSLGNHCYDLRFGKIKIEQIKGAMRSVCFKEGLDINSDMLTQIITSSGNDIRQILNHLSMLAVQNKHLSDDNLVKEKGPQKDTVLGPWEAVRKVFSAEEHKTIKLQDRSRLFFYDYNIAPLFVQENYLQVQPRGNALEAAALTADAISMGDVIESKIRSSNNWSLLESQAFYSSVLPGHYMEGHFTGAINFPSWLGKNSKRGKMQRLASELQSHMRKTASASKTAVNLDYAYYLRNSIVNPLKNNGTAGVEQAIQVMKDYNLLREDLDSIVELSAWSKQPDPMAQVDSKTKAAFTRAYNKDAPVLPYSHNIATKKKVRTSDDVYGDEEENEDSDTDEDDISKNSMIKEKKKPVPKGKKDSCSTPKKVAAKGSRAKRNK